MGESTYSVWIEAESARVWHVYVDPYRIPQWQTGRPVVTDVRGEPGEPGSAYAVRRGPLAARTVVLSSDRSSRLVTRTEASLGLRFEVTSRLEGRAGGTDLELVTTTHWPSGRRWFGRLVELVMLNGHEADKELAMLKTLVERDAAP